MRLAGSITITCLICIQICVSVVIVIALGTRPVQNKTILASGESHHLREDWEKGLDDEYKKMPNGHGRTRTRRINDADIDVVLENTQLCRGVSEVDVVFVVHSTTDHYDRRQIFRTIFQKQKTHTNYTVRHVFLLGQRNDVKIQEIINQEFNQHGDIVQGRFQDSYRNLTYKAVMGLKWISHNCRDVKYVIKMDDDVYVSLRMFFTYIYHQYTGDNRVLCWSWKSSTVLVNRGGKWSIDKDDLRQYDLFPLDYCSGFAVVIPGAITPALYKATRLVPFMWIDDYFLSGMARAAVTKLHDLSPYHYYVIFPQHRAACMKTINLCKIIFSPNTKIRRLPVIKA
ncbi:beta-1,3-galactosyltransferase 5-like [Haliotis rufescens]|uniref:beta-1,3-galactosyltransferase 5-like n=1 Tax=Haliotis rufescens TaxID=6454 RepID=UPI00201F16AB|nr:beta-1,3-galactosyltransferase 5-like [Haliotis rufescens]